MQVNFLLIISKNKKYYFSTASLKKKTNSRIEKEILEDKLRILKFSINQKVSY